MRVFTVGLVALVAVCVLIVDDGLLFWLLLFPYCFVVLRCGDLFNACLRRLVGFVVFGVCGCAVEGLWFAASLLWPVNSVVYLTFNVVCVYRLMFFPVCVLLLVASCRCGFLLL